jgi:prolyl oligopeptidase PreP (S9A serine peptidase family)
MSARGTEIHASCLVQFVATVPSFVWQSGEFANAITDNGAGDVTLTFNAADGVDGTEVVWSGQALNSTRAIVSFETLTDTTTRVRIFDIAGNALADINFCAVALRHVII